MAQGQAGAAESSRAQSPRLPKQVWYSWVGHTSRMKKPNSLEPAAASKLFGILAKSACKVNLTWTAPGTLLQVADHQPFPLTSAPLTQTGCLGWVFPVCLRILQSRAMVGLFQHLSTHCTLCTELGSGIFAR